MKSELSASAWVRSNEEKWMYNNKSEIIWALFYLLLSKTMLSFPHEAVRTSLKTHFINSDTEQLSMNVNCVEATDVHDSPKTATVTYGGKQLLRNNFSLIKGSFQWPTKLTQKNTSKQPNAAAAARWWRINIYTFEWYFWPFNVALCEWFACQIDNIEFYLLNTKMFLRGGFSGKRAIFIQTIVWTRTHATRRTLKWVRWNQVFDVGKLCKISHNERMSVTISHDK